MLLAVSVKLPTAVLDTLDDVVPPVKVVAVAEPFKVAVT
jgi:hypothetical protein